MAFISSLLPKSLQNIDFVLVKDPGSCSAMESLEVMQALSRGKRVAFKSHHCSCDYMLSGFSGESILSKQSDFRHKRSDSACDFMLILAIFPFISQFTSLSH